MVIEQRVKDNEAFWFPVIMGVATKEEVEVASMQDLQYLNEIAYKKQEMLGGGA